MMICDILQTLYEKPHIDTFIIASGDRDFAPVLFNIANYKDKKHVIIIGFADSTSELLITVCNTFGFTFKDYKIDLHDEERLEIRVRRTTPEEKLSESERKVYSCLRDAFYREVEVRELVEKLNMGEHLVTNLLLSLESSGLVLRIGDKWRIKD